MSEPINTPVSPADILRFTRIVAKRASRASFGRYGYEELLSDAYFTVRKAAETCGHSVRLLGYHIKTFDTPKRLAYRYACKQTAIAVSVETVRRLAKEGGVVPRCDSMSALIGSTELTLEDTLCEWDVGFAVVEAAHDKVLFDLPFDDDDDAASVARVLATCADAVRAYHAARGDWPTADTAGFAGIAAWLLRTGSSLAGVVRECKQEVGT